jgi:hypothetical protein
VNVDSFYIAVSSVSCGCIVKRPVQWVEFSADVFYLERHSGFVSIRIFQVGLLVYLRVIIFS